MFLCISTVLSFIIFVAANTHLETRNQCKTGSIQCCNSLQQADQVSSLLSEVGVTVAQAADQGLVGVTCTPLTVVGTGTGCAATQQTVCCLNTNFVRLLSRGQVFLASIEFILDAAYRTASSTSGVLLLTLWLDGILYSI
ncbi:hypothetical protein ID866_4100, partial [Astraeus odoratus]